MGKIMAKKKSKIPQLTKEQVVDLVPCPTCGAWKGTRCAENNRPWTHNHGARVDAALAWIGVTARPVNRRRPDGQPQPTQSTPAKLGKEFYDTWEWKEARFVALKRHGRRCQCCGWAPGMSDDNHLVVDHIKPIRTHPDLALDPENHQVLCDHCNKGKSYKHTDDFRG